MSTFQYAIAFLIQVLFDMYLWVLLLRFLLQFLRANFTNPICQLLIKLTEPVVGPLKKIMPRVLSFDLAILVAVFILDVIKYFLLWLLHTGSLLSPISLIVLSIADILTHIINIFFYAILINIVLSWLSPNTRNPALEILECLSEPLLRPVRRLLPPISGFDLSPIPVLIILKLLTIVIIQPLVGILG